MDSNGGKRRSGPKSRTSEFLGVTQYRRTGRWEAHLWEPAEGERKARQLHLGSFPAAAPAAVAQDRAAYKIRGPGAKLNFPGTDYSVDPFLQRHGKLATNDFVYQLRVWAQSSELALEYGLPEPAAGVAHPVRSRKRAASTAAGQEPAARRQRTWTPEDSEAPASDQDDDVTYVGNVGTSTTEDRQEARRSLRVRRARPTYVEDSDLECLEPEAPKRCRREQPAAVPALVADAKLPSRSGPSSQPPLQAKQGYLPSGPQSAATPDSWAFLDVTPEEANPKRTPFSPGVVRVRTEMWEWEASGRPSMDLHCITGASLLNYRLPGAESTASTQSLPSADDTWPDLPPLEFFTPRKTALGQLPVAGVPTSIEKPLGVAGTAAPPPSSHGSLLEDQDWSFLDGLDGFLSPQQSCQSPRLSTLRNSPGLSPGQGLSPAADVQSLASLADAFEQGHQIPLSPMDMAPMRRQYYQY